MRIFKKEERSNSDIDALRQTVQNAKMPSPVEKVALKEAEKLSKMSPSAAEYTIGINYIEYLVSLPWNSMTEDNLDIDKYLPVGPESVRSIGLVVGNAPHVVEQAAELGLDCYVTGEFTHELYQDCLERVISVLYGGHYATEVYGVRSLSEYVRTELGLETIFIDIPTGM